MSPPWPGDSKSINAERKHPEYMNGVGIRETCDSYAGIITRLNEPPILIGHSFGGLIVQELLGRGIAAAAIAIDPAPIKGVWQLPFSALKASSKVLLNPFNINKAVSLTYDDFRYGFANALSDEEAKELFEEYIVPAPGRPLFQVAFSSVNPNAPNKVNTKLSRGPLLITGGERDHIAPPLFGKESLKKYSGDSVTEFIEFENRGHSLVVDSEWREVAEYVADWLEERLKI